jgi:omega-6 fatty acid desaturase (delta-12 desaturase)
LDPELSRMSTEQTLAPEYIDGHPPVSPPSVLPPPARGEPEPWPPGRRSPKELLAAVRPFAQEDRARSWFHFVETFAVLGGLWAIAFFSPWWWVRLPVSILLGFVIVRGFILYHDFMHLSILRGSTVAKWILYAYGVLVLTPPNVWRQTHNYHHAHTAKIVGSHIGSYLMVTTDMWKQMSAKERLLYKIYRHPLTIFLAYFTVFMYGMCVSSFLRNPRKNWDSLFALIVHFALSALLIVFAGWETFFFAFFLPLFVAMMVGAYLFYAQHDFPDMYVQPRETWEYTRAALESSSYMKTGPILGWLTGNIGYHHVHHLNPAIPFYRLPEAMAAVPELQNPRGTTSLHPRDIIACFRAKLWDPEQQKMVGYPKGT